MRSALALALSALLALAVLPGCSQPLATTQVAAAAAPATATADGSLDPELPLAINDFGFDLARRLLATGENTVISPLSVHAALSMTAMGARGDTAREMESVLHLDRVDADTDGWSWPYLLGKLYEPDGVTLEIANSLWAQKDAPFESEFLDANRDYFGAEIRSLDLQAPGAADEINGWVAEKTQDRITEIIDNPDPAAVMELVNAVYFLADWAESFDEAATSSQPFTLSTGDPVDVDMMQAMREWDYGESETLQIVRLPYATEDFAAYVLVPQGDLGPGDVLETMDATTWKSLTRLLLPREGSVTLPRFEIEWGAGTDLSGPLAEMGMASAFDRARR